MCTCLEVKDATENVILKAVQAGQEILVHVGVPGEQVAIHAGPIRSY